MFMKKELLFLFCRILVAGITLFVVITKVDFAEIRFAFENPEKPELIVVVLILLIPNLFLQLYRWHYLLRLNMDNVSVEESVSSFFSGMVIGFITPGRVGEFGRSFFLKRMDRWEGVSLVFIDKLYSFIVLTTGGIWGITFLIGHILKFERFILWPLCGVALFVTIFMVMAALNPVWIRNLIYQISLVLPNRDKLKLIMVSLDRFDKDRALKFFLYSFLLYCIYIIQFCLLSLSFQSFPLSTALIVTTSTIFAKTFLPISLGDLGIRESASVFFYMQFGVDKATAFNSSLMLFVINILVPTMMGLFFLFGIERLIRVIKKRI